MIEKKEKNEKKKKRIILKIFAGIAIIVAILAILFLINFIRNLVIINEFIEKQANFKDSTNYAYYSTLYDTNDEENKVTVEHLYKDGKDIMILDNGNSKIKVWYDEETKENIFLDEKNKQATVTTSEFLLGNELLYFYNEENKIYYALTSFIINSNIDGKECYEVIHLGTNTYINKEDGTVLKEVYRNVIVNGKKCDSVTEYSNWKFNELTDEEMAKPDLAGYTVVDN